MRVFLFYSCIRKYLIGAILPQFLFVLFSSAMGAMFPFAACFVFDSVLPHGIVSADIFFLILLLATPKGKVLRSMPFIVLSSILAIISNTIDAYATAGVCIVIVFLCSLIPRRRSILLPVFVVLSLFFLVADWGNFFYSTFVLTIPDIWGLAKFFWWGPLLFITVPLLQIALVLLFARKILWGKNPLQLTHLTVYIIIAISVGLNFSLAQVQNKWTIMDFAVKTWFYQIFTPGIIGQNSFLQEDIKSAFPIWLNGVNVVDDVARPTIVVLVESYGINKSVAYTDSLIEPFKKLDASFVGLFQRDAGHTQGAEWEDFGTPNGTNKGTSLPQQFKQNGLQTWFLHGYNANFYERQDNYGEFGFDSLLFKDDLLARGLQRCHYGFEGVCDSSVVVFIDSLMTDSLPKFIYWTTLDAHPPYEFASVLKRSTVCKSLKLSDVDCTYFTLQQNTVLDLVKLAQKHPNYRFVIRGDHRPMGSLEQSDFVQSFYFRWVPLIILN